MIEIKTEIIFKNNQPVPDVGQFWHHIGSNEIYLRIVDRDGLKKYPGEGDYFFSLCLNDFTIRKTLRVNCMKTLVLLKIDEPLKFTEV